MNRVAKFQKWCQSHKVISVLLVIGIIIVALGNVTDSLDKILGFVRQIRPSESSDSNASIQQQRLAATNPLALGSKESLGTSSPVDESSESQDYTKSFKSFYSRLGALKDRFSEYDLYTKSVEGTPILWDFAVNDVSRSIHFISLSLGAQDCAVIADFPNSFEVRLFALKKGDLVRVTGTIQEADTSHIFISATNFWLLNP